MSNPVLYFKQIKVETEDSTDNVLVKYWFYPSETRQHRAARRGRISYSHPDDDYDEIEIEYFSLPDGSPIPAYLEEAVCDWEVEFYNRKMLLEEAQEDYYNLY